MAKLIWKGWQKDPSNAAQPTGPFVKRDGSVVISLCPSHLEVARKLAEWNRDQKKRKGRA